MNNTRAFCLLLVEKDNLTASRLHALAESTGVVVRRDNAGEVGKWLASRPSLGLVITDSDNASPIITLIRRDPYLNHVPVLISCGGMNKKPVKVALETGASDLLDLTDNTEQLQSKISYYLDLNATVLSLEHTESAHNQYNFSLPWWKRGIDIAVSLTALLLLLPLLLLVAILIKLDSRGPVLYKSPRAGSNFTIFNMYKFRTMKVMADALLKELKDHNIYAKKSDDTENVANGLEFRCDECRMRGIACQQPLFDQHEVICEKKYLLETEGAAKFMKFRNDPRITRLGTFLRNSSIDELPQLLNILLGDMSLVGNRPLPLYEAEKLTSNQSAQRFAGPAGLTGLWQVKKRARGVGPVTDKERIELDIEYARTFSFKTDMYIIWKTFFTLWQKENV
ncbi:sugar transferase [Spirosoma luteolum]